MHWFSVVSSGSVPDFSKHFAPFSCCRTDEPNRANRNRICLLPSYQRWQNDHAHPVLSAPKSALSQHSIAGQNAGTGLWAEDRQHTGGGTAEARLRGHESATLSAHHERSGSGAMGEVSYSTITHCWLSYSWRYLSIVVPYSPTWWQPMAKVMSSTRQTFECALWWISVCSSIWAHSTIAWPITMWVYNL